MATEVQHKEPQNSRQAISGVHSAWLVAISLLMCLWLWAAFVRSLTPSVPAQILLALLVAGLVASAGLLVMRLLQQRSALGFGGTIRVLAHSSSAFLLLLVFLPEYLLGRPALARSFILLGISLLLFGSYLALALPRQFTFLWPKFLRSRRTPAIALFSFCVIYFSLTTWVTLAKLHAFGYVGQDIAYFTQCLYTTLHGQLFYSNMYHDLLYQQPVTTDFASHNQLVLFLLLPFFALHKAASTLLILRNIFVVLCAWPLYLIGRRFLAPGLAAAAAMAFLVIPAVLYQNFYDFAPLSLAGFPLFFALYYFLEEKYVPYMIALLCAQIVREDLFIAVFGLGLLALWYRRGFRWVAIPCAFALLWAYTSWKIMFPHFLQGTTSAVASCFAYLGSSPGDMIHNTIHHPGMFLSHKVVVYLKEMVDSYGGVLFLLNPAWLISIPYIAINVAAEGGGCNTAMIYRHYSLIPTVFLFAAVLMALKKIGTLAEKRDHRQETAQKAVILFLLAAALTSTVFVTGQEQFAELQSRPWHAEARQIVKMLPTNASVAVPRYMLPGVAGRDGLYQSLRLLEYHNPDAGYIVMDKDWQRMAATQQWRDNYDALRHQLETDHQYQVIYDSPDYVIYKLCDGCTPSLPHREPVKDARD